MALVLMGAVALATGAYPLVIDWTFDALAAGDAGWIMLVPPVIVAVTAEYWKPVRHNTAAQEAIARP